MEFTVSGYGIAGIRMPSGLVLFRGWRHAIPRLPGRLLACPLQIPFICSGINSINSILVSLDSIVRILRCRWAVKISLQQCRLSSPGRTISRWHVYWYRLPGPHKTHAVALFNHGTSQDSSEAVRCIKSAMVLSFFSFFINQNSIPLEDHFDIRQRFKCNSLLVV